VVQTVLDEAVQFNLDQVVLIMRLQGHRYWDQLCQQSIRARSKQFQVCLQAKMMWLLMDQLEHHNPHLDFRAVGAGFQVRCQWLI
jgi:hypothetical protein